MHHRKKTEPATTIRPSTTELPMPANFIKPSTPLPPRFKSLLLIFSLLLNLYLTVNLWHPFSPLSPIITPLPESPLTRRHLLFGIASSSLSWSRRQPYVRSWYSPSATRAFAFLDRPVLNTTSSPDIPLAVVSADTSNFPYTLRGGLRSAIRVARVVKEVVDRNESDVRWFVFGDDDTVFFVDNLVSTLSKYDHNRWFYIGSNSESYEQNVKYSFDMAFGGGGFAISYSLARVLSKVLDSCLRRYSHLYGSDSRIYSCLAELGVGLTHEPGFHQLDMRGNLFGMLAAHPLSPLVSLHHLDAVEPLFPNLNRSQALEHLFAAANVDPARILQQTVCYERANSLTVSISWGHSVQIFHGNVLLPDLLSLQRTFVPWKRGRNVEANFMFNVRDYPRDPCKRPSVFHMRHITSDKWGIQSNYERHVAGNCLELDAINQLKQIRVFSRKLKLDIEQMKAPRRQCCNVLPSSDDQSMTIHIRECGIQELIFMRS